MYDKKLQELSDKEQRLCIELQEHLQGDTDYKTTVAIVFSLARRARAIFDGSEVTEKQQLLRLLLQNCTLNGKTLNYTVRSPFNALLGLQGHPYLLPDMDSNHDTQDQNLVSYR